MAIALYQNTEGQFFDRNDPCNCDREGNNPFNDAWDDIDLEDDDAEQSAPVRAADCLEDIDLDNLLPF